MVVEAGQEKVLSMPIEDPYSNSRTNSFSISGTSMPCGHASTHWPHSVQSEAFFVVPKVFSMP